MQSGRMLIQVQSVSKFYGAHRALYDVSLDLHKGEVVSLLGANGAGKTTLSSIIASLSKPSSGDVLFKGTSIYRDLIGFRNKLGFCPQKPNFTSTLTIKEHLIFAGHYYLMEKELLHERVHFLLKHFELDRYQDQSPTVLSGGYKQRLLIARALIHQPELIILDEPTVALDPHVRRHVWDLIKELKKQGVTVLLTTHYLDEAELLSDRVCVLEKGVVLLVDTPQHLLETYNKQNLEAVFLQLLEEEIGGQ